MVFNLQFTMIEMGKDWVRLSGKNKRQARDGCRLEKGSSGVTHNLYGFYFPVVSTWISPVANCIMPRSQNFKTVGSANVEMACPSEQWINITQPHNQAAQRFADRENVFMAIFSA